MGDCPVCGHDCWVTTYDYDDMENEDYCVVDYECVNCSYTVIQTEKM